MLDSVVIQGTFCNIFLLSMSCAGASLTRHSASMPVRRVCELRGWIMCACAVPRVCVCGTCGGESLGEQAKRQRVRRLMQIPKHGTEKNSSPCRVQIRYPNTAKTVPTLGKRTSTRPPSLPGTIDMSISSNEASKSQKRDFRQFCGATVCCSNRNVKFENFLHLKWSKEKFSKGIVGDKTRLRF